MRYNRATAKTMLRWLCYALFIIVAVTLQTTPRFLDFGGIQPLLVVPACLAFALYEGEFAGALVGAAGGLLWDASAGRISGFFAIILMVSCFMASCLWQLYLRDSFVNFLWLVALGCFVALNLDFLVSYLVRGYPGAGEYYLLVLLPMCLLTTLCGLPLRLVARRISRIGRPKQ